MSTRRVLIVNADDFGLSDSVNRGVREAHEHGIVTSASLMVRRPAAAAAAAYSREHPDLSVGLHFDLWEWAYRDGAWVSLYEVVQAEDAEAVAGEAAHQLDLFRSLLRKEPTHLDSHQHVHLREPVRTVLLELAERHGIPLRQCDRQVRYCGDFYGQAADGAPLPEAISVEALIGILASLPAGVSELSCHPGAGNNVDLVYSHERVTELQVLCDPRVRAALAAEGVELRAFGRTAP